MSLNLNEFAKDVHLNADNHGWWDDERSTGEILSLIHSEWSEALEEYRAGRPMVWYQGGCTIYGKKCVPDAQDECPDNPQDCGAYKQGKPEGIAVELLDGIIRIFDFLGAIDAELAEEKTIDDMLERMPEERKQDCECSFPEYITYLHALTSEALFEETAEKAATVLMTAVAMVFYWVKMQGVDPEKVMLEKHEYNKGRPYKHGNKLC